MKQTRPARRSVDVGWRAAFEGPHLLALNMRPTTSPLASTSKSSSLHSADGREVVARFRMRYPCPSTPDVRFFLWTSG